MHCNLRFPPAAVKHKSRSTPEGFKHSVHVVFDVCARPGVELRDVCHFVFAPFREQMRQKGFSGFTDAFLRGKDAPCIGADTQTMGGCTPFAWLFSKKKSKDPESALVARHFFQNGELMVFSKDAKCSNPHFFKPSPADNQHRLADLTDDQAVELLRQCSCSIPRHYMSSVAPDVSARAKIQQSRTAARQPAISGPPPAQGGASSSDAGGLDLPEWFRNYVRGVKGCVQRQSSANSYLSMLPTLDCPGADRAAWEASHLSKWYCPARMAQKMPVIYQHTNNGTIVAVNKALPGKVYLRCPYTCCDVIETNPHVKRMHNTNGYSSPWFEFTEDGLHDIMSEEGWFDPTLLICRKIPRLHIPLRKTTEAAEHGGESGQEEEGEGRCSGFKVEKIEQLICVVIGVCVNSCEIGMIQKMCD